MPLIELEKLHPDPRNSNVCSPETLDKLTRNIQRSNICPVLLVRHHPVLTGEYMILDGHHRKQIIKTLGWSQVECQVISVNDTDAGLLLLTLNRLRGEDNPRKRAELIEELLPIWELPELALLLPESTAEIDGLLALLQQEDEALEQALKEQLAREAATLPVPLGFMIPADEISIVQEALARYQAHSHRDQAQALVAICRDVLALEHEEVQAVVQDG